MSESVESLFIRNEHGLWCPACGERIAKEGGMDDDYMPPDSCPTCGFPDFEDGVEYFTDDDKDD